MKLLSLCMLALGMFEHNLLAMDLVSLITQNQQEQKTIQFRDQQILNLVYSSAPEEYSKQQIKTILYQGLLPATILRLGQKLLEQRRSYENNRPRDITFQMVFAHMQGAWLLKKIGLQKFTMLVYPRAYKHVHTALLENMIEQRDIPAIKLFLPFSKDKVACTHKAAERGLWEAVRFAIEEKYVDRHCLYGGITLLVRAARAVPEEDRNNWTLRYLLSLSDINVNQQTVFGNTALHYAVLVRSKSRIRALCDHGALIEIYNHKNFTPLDVAQCGPKDIVAILEHYRHIQMCLCQNADNCAASNSNNGHE